MALTKPGLLGGTAATGYPSIWGEASGGPGILGYTPPGFTPGVGVGAPMPTYKAPVRTGGTIYGNYVRNYPDLLAAFKDPTNINYPNIAGFGKAHWEGSGSNEGRILPTINQINPNIALGDVMDLGPSATKVGSSGLPMPDVEGYKYEYPIYSWGGSEDPSYSYVGSNATDIDEYPYYPYQPTGEPVRSRNNRVLIGVRLVPK